jgi:hypothetical protein
MLYSAIAGAGLGTLVAIWGAEPAITSPRRKGTTQTTPS